MYVDPMILFIIGEVLVVYIIINVFLFYKSRLYQVLVALLKEMRFEKLRREQLKKTQLAGERSLNRHILNRSDTFDDMPAGRPGIASLTEQLNNHITALNEQFPNAHDLTNSVERDKSSQWLRLRILELENELLNGNISEQHWEALAKETIQRLQDKEADEKQSIEDRKDSAEKERYIGELQSDLSESENKLADARLRIRQLESEIEEFKTIYTPSESHMESPTSGLYDDEIYRLKCENFDMTESINKLKLELQKEDPSSGNDAYLRLLKSQLANMEQYIKSADIQNNLLEKEASANKKIIENQSKQLSLMGTNASTVDLSPLSDLSHHYEAKTETLVAFRDTVDRLKKGEALEVISSEQEAHIRRLEKIITESQQCIFMLESELQRSSKDLINLEKERADRKYDRIDNKLDQLNNAQKGQKTGVNSLKTLISDIREGGDADALLVQQEKEIEKLEHFLGESHSLISQLEGEIEQLQNILELQQLAGESKQNERPNSDENVEEMEELLQQFIVDIQSLMRTINRLEDENSHLRTLSEAHQNMKPAAISVEQALVKEAPGSKGDLLEEALSSEKALSEELMSSEDAWPEDALDAEQALPEDLMDADDERSEEELDAEQSALAKVLFSEDDMIEGTEEERSEETLDSEKNLLKPAESPSEKVH